MKNKEVSSIDYSIFFLNLESSKDRLENFRKNFHVNYGSFTRIPSVYGRFLPLAAASQLVRNRSTKSNLGRLGCMLSHVSAWENIVDNLIGNCLILEDDTYPLRALPICFDDLQIPSDYDVCFVNRRMSFGLNDDDQSGCVATNRAIQNFPDEHNAPGGDGYFISLKGAKRLIAIFVTVHTPGSDR